MAEMLLIAGLSFLLGFKLAAWMGKRHLERMKKIWSGKDWAEHMINDVLPGPRPADALPGESCEDYVNRTGKPATQSGQGLPRIKL